MVKLINHTRYMNSEISTLYSIAHELLYLGMDGAPIYSDHFSRLNREVSVSYTHLTLPTKLEV